MCWFFSTCMTWYLSISAALLVLLAGCAAPGSTLTRSSIRGKLLDRQGQPLSGQKVEVSLPSSYGLQGLDSAMGKPEDYGHRDETAVLRTDRNGEFHHLFQVRTRSVTYFLLPPLGPVPRQPPRPYYEIRTPRHRYLVGWNRDRFDYRSQAIDKPAGRSAGQVSGVYMPRESEGIDGWESTIEIRE